VSRDATREACDVARTARLLVLLQLLRGKRRPVTAAALAAELGISERTVYRDIAELGAQGAPIAGEAGVGYVLGPGLFLPPLMLDDDETEAVVLGLRYVDQRGDDVLSHAAREALTKIGAVLSPAAQEAMRNPVALPGPGGPGFPRNTVELRFLRAAIKAQAKLEIAYADAAGVRTRRVVWPIALGFANEARVLMAWCETRQAYRTFRTDRIAAATRRERYPGWRVSLLAEWRAALAGSYHPDKN
jgi:predicted DNA-binding transcriptional regulator YafY